MAFEIGAVVARIKADTSDFNDGLKKAQTTLGSFKSGLQGVNDRLASFRNGMALIGGVAGIGVGKLLLDSSEAAKELEKALISLDIIAERFGVNGDDAAEAAEMLGRKLRIGVGAAADSLQNLLKSNLTLEQSVDLMERFANEALTGKSSSISLSQAVQNLSFAYATNNSALGNLSGINENFQDIIMRGRDALIAQGVAADSITEEMAKYRGMMDLTNLTLGASDRLAGSLSDKQADLDQKFTDLKVTVGQALNPALSELIDLVVESGIIEDMGDWAKEYIPRLVESFTKFANWIRDNQVLVIEFLKGLAIAISALTIASTVSSLLLALTNPITLVIVGITALFVAWQTNFLGMRDIVYAVWSFLKQAVQGWIIIFGWLGDGLKLLGEGVKRYFEFWKYVYWDIPKMVIENFNNMLGWLAGIPGWLGGWGRQIFDSFTHPFINAWNTIKGYVNRIRNALDFTKRQSPSVLDLINRSVKLANRAIGNLDLTAGGLPNASAIAGGIGVGLAGVGGGVTGITINLPNAIVSDEAGARRISEIIGDHIIRRVQSNARI